MLEWSDSLNWFRIDANPDPAIVGEAVLTAASSFIAEQLQRASL
jgi:hypothetical protein